MRPAALSALTPRSDQQIVALEMWAVLLALESFAERLSGAYVKLWIDNRAGEAILRRGSAACEDHNLIAHCVWTAAYVLKVALWVERVSSEDNLADEPSRQHFETLEGLQARMVEPACANRLWKVDQWREIYGPEVLRAS